MNIQKTESKLPVFKVFRPLSAKSGLETQHLREIVGGRVEMNFARFRALTRYVILERFNSLFSRNELRPIQGIDTQLYHKFSYLVLSP